MERYFVYIRELATIGLIFHHRDKQVRIGGNKRFQVFIESIITDYFEKSLPRVKKHQNKVRYKLRDISYKRFLEVKEIMEEHAMIFQNVCSLERIMR